MKKRYFKIIAAIALVAIMALSLFSCGQSAPASVTGQRYDGKSGEKSVSVGWDYDSSTYTLTITGSGDMPNATSANGVAWSNIKGSVKTIKFVNQNNVPITSIGDYAFYGMSNLTSVELPDGITKIGKLAFGYCFSLKNITTNKNLTSIGESAFEGCLSLTDITLPISVTSVGKRTFAFCKNLKNVTIAGKVTELPVWMFKDCKKLASVTLRDSFNKDNINEAAFEGCAIFKDKITYVSVPDDGKITVKVYYINSAGNYVEETLDDGSKKTYYPETKTYDFGEEYAIEAYSIKGYTLDGTFKRTGVVNQSGIEEIYKYIGINEIPPSAPPSETTPSDQAKPADQGITTGTIIGISIFAVVIIALGVVIFIFMRPSKDNKNGKNNQKKK